MFAFASWSYSAGTVTPKSIKTHTGQTNKADYLTIVPFDVTADASTAAVPTVTSNFTGLLSDVGFYFDAVTPPNSLTYTVKDGYGAIIAGPTTITATAARPILTSPIPVIGVSITFTGNTTNSAKFIPILYFM